MGLRAKAANVIVLFLFNSFPIYEASFLSKVFKGYVITCWLWAWR